MRTFKMISTIGLFLFGGQLYSQALWEVEVDTSVSPIELQIAVVTQETTHLLDRVTQTPPSDSNDTLMVDIYMEPCNLPGSFLSYDLTLELEDISYPFNLCVNTYVDTLIPTDTLSLCHNDSLMPGDFLCTPAGEVLSLATRIKPQPLTFYPNPASDKVKIKLPQTAGATKFNGAIYSSTGEVVKKFVTRGRDLMEVDISFLSEGLYFLRMEAENKVWQGRLLKL